MVFCFLEGQVNVCHTGPADSGPKARGATGPRPDTRFCAHRRQEPGAGVEKHSEGLQFHGSWARCSESLQGAML